MELRLLGPVQVLVAGELVDGGQPRQRCVLAALAVDAGRPVPVATLVDRVWGEDPPRRPQHALYVYVTGIRKLIQHVNPDCGAGLVRRSGGYVLDVEADRVDVHRFRRLLAQARGGPVEESVLLLRQALELWRGPPLADLSGQWPARVRQGWHHEYLDAVTAWAAAEVRVGNAGTAIGALTDLVEEHPLNEALVDSLMRVLHAAGRSADALDCYAQARARLVDQLGTDPGPGLQHLHRAILSGDLEPPPSRPRLAATTAATPAQLPADVAGFAGRADQLGQLTALLHNSGGAATAVVISAIAGTAGVGKTALAVHWAHQVRDRFPDGQLYVNLRGFDPTDKVMDPAEAVRRFLDALAVPAQRIPADPGAQADLYRSLLATKKMLLVLDNARDPDQVGPLLPGAPGCLVLVTSRNRLSGLIAAAGAHPIPLDPLSVDEARDLLARRIGAGRVAAEPDAVDQIITRCARLPLALAIVAANAATQLRLPLAAIATKLRDSQDRLGVLSTGDSPNADVRAVFSWSYRALSPAAARLFRLLGLHPGPNIATPAAASLAALPADQAYALLAELVRANLLAEPVPGRFALHDLLRAYAADLAHTTHPKGERRAVTHRILDHYLHTAYAARQLLDRTRDLISLTPPQPGVTPEAFADHAQALAWFTAEHVGLLAVLGHAAATGFDTHTWQLTWTLNIFVDPQRHWHDWATTWRAAVAAAGRLADPPSQARTHRLLALAYRRVGRFEDAHIQLRHALDLSRQTGDRIGQALTHLLLAWMWWPRDRYGEALDHARQALDLFRAAGDRPGQASAFKAVGWYHAQIGDHRQTLTYCQQAIPLYQELDDRTGLADTWRSLGYAHHHLGHHTHAITCYQHAIDLYRDLANRYLEATTLTHLGDTHHTTGDNDAARDAWQLALTILDQLDHPDADQVRSKLDRLNPEPTPG